MAHHSSVNYIEPNYISNDANGMPWKVKDDYERAPRLEDYCIALNLEVEICGRENISQGSKTSSEVLILSYHTKQGDGSASTVSFLGGTKVSTGKGNYATVPYLTTNYADMYVGDLVDYGTTELIGIKSVDIEYQRGCVPIVNIVFTDVRGLSLFQPTELSRTNAYQGIGGINADNVAQSFFQCFFKLPMPRFTLTVKGFYGNPVTYEVLCDKFDTKFNSSTGDYEVTTRFIGYSYSFLTDIAIDALISAPYSDYPGGKDYWESEKANGRFAIWNKEKTDKRPMPTLVEILQEMRSITTASTSASTTLSVEEDTHSGEIGALQDILDKSRSWYSTLFDICCKLYGKDYCYLFKEDGDDGDIYRIIILTNSSTDGKYNMGYFYDDFPDTFKRETQNLHSTIETYNQNTDNFKKLDNVSVDFTEYTRLKLFNNCFVNFKGEVIFNGFNSVCKLPKTQIVNNVFYGKEIEVGEYDEAEDIKKKENENKKNVLSLIYNNGVDQYIDCYNIDIDFRPVKARINALQADANKDVKEREHEQRIKEINKIMFDKMSWYPTIENFTKIMCAHLETLMKMMYNTVDRCSGRTASELGITCGPNGNASDVRAGAKEIPPFPKATREIIDDDGISKFEDCWVGEFNGEKGFEEVNFIDGLFNAAEVLADLYKDMETRETEMNREINPTNEVAKPIIKHPLSSFDFFIAQNPYGDSEALFNDLKGYELAARIGFRMYNIMGNNNLKRDLGSGYFTNGDNAKKLGECEAENFYALTRFTNDKFITMLRDTDYYSGKNVIDILTKANDDENCPWGKNALFSIENGAIKPTYFSNGVMMLYPVQGYTISGATTHSKALRDHKVGNYNESMFLYGIPTDAKGTLPNDRGGFGNVIIYNDYKTVTDYLQGANSYGDNVYTTIYNSLTNAAQFNGEKYQQYFDCKDSLSVTRKAKDVSKAKYFILKNTANGGNEITVVYDDGSDDYYNISNIDNIKYDVQSGNFEHFTILQMFAPGDNNNRLKGLVPNSSILKDNQNYLSTQADGYTLSGNQVLLTKMLLGIKLNSDNVYKDIKKGNTVNYIPRLAALQIGALIFQSGGVSKKEIETLSNRVPSHYYKDFIDNHLNTASRMSYMKYYLNWINSHSEFVSLGNNAKHYISPDPKDTSNHRMILRQDDPLVVKFTNELLMPVCIINISYLHKVKRDDKTNKPSDTNYLASTGFCETFLNGFFEQLRKLLGAGYEEDENGNLVKTTGEPKKTSQDMKIELYRYMKQIYDKWIPMSSFKDWKLESFFMETSGSEENGHKFHFIDSFYNEISHKLLINPKTISDRVDSLLSYQDVNATMLGFMTDIYSANKCMLMTIQNFADLKKEGCMDEMFTPKSFNSIDWANLNKYPSFVVVYPYSPSRNLEVANGEYSNDSFMLNDEFETPVAIRSKTGDQMKIPAFGVSYGKQYQSYFKSINVNMQSPIETEQSIKAKHYIIRQQRADKSKVSAAQDLYDIYSTRSYTCDVEMMGCAWVQPMMYFVLLNVPTFRGSYMIMKVRHSIRPGDMTTRFTGCRMANSSTKLVENIFSDEDWDNGGGGNGSYGSYESQRNEKADIDNDCPYKIYPLFGGDNSDLVDIIKKYEGGYAGNWDGKGCTMKGVTIDVYREYINKNATCDDLRNITDDDWYTIFKTKFWDRWQADSIRSKCIANLVVDWHWTSGQYGIFYPQEVVGLTRDSTKAGIKKTVDTFNAYSNQQELFNKLKERRKQHFEALAKQGGYKEKSLNGWLNRLSAFDYFDNPSEKSENVDENDVDIGLFEALSRTCLNTPSISTKIKLSYKKGEYAYITQDNGKNDKLHLVFDALLNSDYVQYVRELGWVSTKGGLQTDTEPVKIVLTAQQTVSDEKRRVFCMEEGTSLGRDSNNVVIRYKNEIPMPTDDKNSNCNPKLLKSLGKRLAKIGNADAFKKEVPQVKDTTLMSGFTPQSCDSLFGGGGDGVTYDPSQISPGDAGYIEGWNVGAACTWIKAHSPKSTGICATRVLEAISVGSHQGNNCKMPGSANGQNRIHCGGGGEATWLRYGDVLAKNGFVKIAEGSVAPGGTPSYTPQSGDVAIIGPPAPTKPYHACMYTSDGWVSDFKQGKIMCPSSYSKYKKDTQPYAIYRYKNKKKSEENYGF